jgi:hypothetical protein
MTARHTLPLLPLSPLPTLRSLLFSLSISLSYSFVNYLENTSFLSFLPSCICFEIQGESHESALLFSLSIPLSLSVPLSLTLYPSLSLSLSLSLSFPLSLSLRHSLSLSLSPSLSPSLSLLCRGLNVVHVSVDKDMLQLVDTGVHVSTVHTVQCIIV